MNIEVKDFSQKIVPVLKWLRRYAVVILIVAVVAMYGWLVFRINVLSRREPTDDAVTEKLQTLKKPKVDQSTIDKMKQLEETNIDVQTLFKQARENPFQE